jgi:hypothetical protein
MATTRKCAECGASLPDDLPDSSCAVCVLRGALTMPKASELPGTEKIGDRIGRYKLLEKIGEGGYGSLDSERMHKSDLDEIRRIIREEDLFQPTTRVRRTA